MEIRGSSREIVHGRQEGTFLTFFLPLEHKNGYVFLLADIDKSCKASSRVIALYRESIERLARTLSDRSHLQHRFEQTLQALNDDMKDIFASEKAQPTQISTALGVLRDEEFIFSGTGKLNVLFLRKTARQNIKFYDLTHNIASESGPPKIDKFFATVLDGELQAEDVFMIASSELSNLLDLEEVHPLLSRLPPSSALETIEQYLPVKARLAVLLFQVKEEKEILTGYAGHSSAKASMDTLSSAEKRTESMLTMETPHLQETFLRLVSVVKSGTSQERMTVLKTAGSRLFKWLKVGGVYTMHILGNIAMSAKSLTIALLNRGSKRKTALSGAKSVWSRTFKSGKHQFMGMKMSGQVVLIAAGIFIVLFVSSIVGIRSHQKTSADNEAFDALITQVEEKRDETQASLIYKDEAAARRSLLEAVSILESIDTSDASRAERVREQFTLLEDGFNQIRHVLKPQITLLPVVNNRAMATDGSVVMMQDSRIQRIDGTELKDTSISNESEHRTRLATEYQNDMVIVTAASNIARYKTSEGLIQTVGINSVEGELKDAVDIFQYGERLYVLVPQDGQVYRHQLVENGDYGPASPWLTDTPNISNATSITVDGSVWIGGKNSLRRFEGGTEVGFNTGAIDPSIGGVEDIWADQDSDLLFVLDAQNSRLIVLNKETEEVVAQYTDPQLNTATSMSIDLDNRTAYVVAPSSVLVFPLTSVVQ